MVRCFVLFVFSFCVRTMPCVDEGVGSGFTALHCWAPAGSGLEDSSLIGFPFLEARRRLWGKGRLSWGLAQLWGPQMAAPTSPLHTAPGDSGRAASVARNVTGNLGSLITQVPSWQVPFLIRRSRITGFPAIGTMLTAQ